MDRQPTRPVPMGKYSAHINDEVIPEVCELWDTLEVEISTMEKDSVDRLARIPERDQVRQAATQEWERTRPKPAGIHHRRKSAIQRSVMRDANYLAAATAKPKRRFEQRIEEDLRQLLSPPATPVATDAWSPFDFDLRHLLTPTRCSPPREVDFEWFRTPPLLSPIQSPQREINFEWLRTPPLLSPLHSPPRDPISDERLFDGVVIRWELRFDRTKNSAGEPVRVNITKTHAYLKHLATKIKITREKPKLLH